MSEGYSAEYDELNDDAEFENHLSDEDGTDEDGTYEEIDEDISTDEVDRVLETVTSLLESVESATIHEYLEEAYNHIFSLVYEEEEAEDGTEEVALTGLEEEYAGSLDEEAIEEDEEYENDFGEEGLRDDEAA